MGKDKSRFKFKQFSLSHHRSSMKVGVDGVLLGCWADVDGAREILDVGTGCGLIAMMMAQRCPYAKVTGIDIDQSSAEEARENMNDSQWADRMSIIHGSFPNDIGSVYSSGFDLIVSNPPFFDSGVTQIVTSRERARHQGSLSPSLLLYQSKDLLTPGGSLAMVVPSEFSSSLEEMASCLGYTLWRKCLVRGHNDAPYKRTLLQWHNGSSLPECKDDDVLYLTLEYSRGIPTEEYRLLCKDFYLKF